MSQQQSGTTVYYKLLWVWNETRKTVLKVVTWGGVPFTFTLVRGCLVYLRDLPKLPKSSSWFLMNFNIPTFHIYLIYIVTIFDERTYNEYYHVSYRFTLFIVILIRVIIRPWYDKVLWQCWGLYEMISGVKFLYYYLRFMLSATLEHVLLA